MATKDTKQKVEALLALADVQIDGTRPWDIKVNNEQLYERILAGGILAAGEAYMDGWWNCAALDQMIDKILRVKWNLKEILPKRLAWDILKAKFINQQRRSKAYEIGKRHYDTGNKLFQAMLDKRMNYSCAYWKDAENLDEAQEAKLALICKKLKIKPRMTVLDIGCGWGSLAQYIAENFQAKVTGIIVSKEQVKLARERCKGWMLKSVIRIIEIWQKNMTPLFR